jgi:hypothetical protein
VIRYLHQNSFYLCLLFLFLGACRRPIVIPVHKVRGEISVVMKLQDPEIQKQTKHRDFYVLIDFPRTHLDQEILFSLKLSFPRKNAHTVIVKVPSDLDLDLGALSFSGNRVHLQLLPNQGARRRYESPTEPLFATKDYVNRIGHMERITKSWIWGLVPYEWSECAAFPLGSSLVMTNYHCISTQAQCRAASFNFYDDKEKWLFGWVTVDRDYPCLDLVYPSIHYGHVRLMSSPEIIPSGTPVLVFTARKESAVLCFTGESGKNYRTVNSTTIKMDSTDLTCAADLISGDSGSPVFNYHGDLIGIYWGGAVANARESHMTPIISLMRAAGQKVLQLPLEWVRR